MKKATLLLGFVFALSSYANIGNLSYFTGEKTMSFNASADYEVTEAYTTNSENSGFNFNLGMNYGILPNNAIGASIGYGMIDTDFTVAGSTTTSERSGISDVNVTWAHRFVNSANHNWDAIVNFSPKTGEAKIDNNFKGYHDAGLTLSYTTRMMDNLEGMLSFNGGYAFEDSISNDWGFTTKAGARFHATPMIFVGATGSLMNGFNGRSNVPFSEPTFNAGANAGFKINPKSNIVANAAWVDERSTNTDGWNFGLNYNMEL